MAVWSKPMNLMGYNLGASWAFSQDGGQSWSPSQHFDRGSLNGISGEHSAACVDGEGRFFAAVRGTGPGYVVAVMRGDVIGNVLSWQPPVRVVAEAFGTVSAHEALDLSCDPLSGTLYLTWTRGAGNYRPSTGWLESEQVFLSRSVDHGQTWSVPMALGSTNSFGAQSAVGPNGELFVVWYDFGTGEMRGRRSNDGGLTFGPEFVAAPVYWNTLSTPDFGLELPTVAVDTSPGPRRGTMYVTWAERAAGSVSGPTSSVYEHEPNEWCASATEVAIGQDIYGETSAVSKGGSEPNDDDIYVFDGVRGQTIHLSGAVEYVYSNYPFDPSIGHQVYFQCVEDTVQLDGPIGVGLSQASGPAREPFVYTLPATGRYYLRMLTGGFVTIGYVLRLREYQVEASSVVRDARDVVLVRSADGGATWSGKVRVNNDPAGAHQGTPSVVVDELGQVHVAWYDRRDDPGCGYLVDTWWGVSSDGGVSFPRQQRASTASSPWRLFGTSGSHAGYHQGLAAGAGRVHLLWTQVTAPNEIGIYAARVEDVATGVAVSGLAAEVMGSAVRVSWFVSDASRVSGLRLERAPGTSEYVPLAAQGPDFHGAGSYVVMDGAVEPGMSYYYRLGVVDRDGAVDWLEPVGVRIPSVGTFALRTAGPNPFVNEARLLLTLPVAGAASVRVYDITGHEVARLLEGHVVAGTHTLAWDGRDRHGRASPAGVYLVRASGEQGSSTLRVLRMN